MKTNPGVITRLIEDSELQGLLASIGAGLVGQGFVPQGNVPGLYIYTRKRRPSVAITILLLLLWIIPGIIYLFIGGQRAVVSINVTELPLGIEIDGADAVQLPVCLSFMINAPTKFRKQITRVLAPYSIDIDYVIAHPEQVLVGQTLQKRVEVDCEHCGRHQQVSLPFRIDRVEGNRGYGPGSSMTVTCCDPSCGKPFEVDWDNVVVGLVLSG
ncbi:MAG TPA: hypothetical protein VIK22_03830 [Candidatus Anoxymicrobiaceae bacterium]